MGKLDIQKNVCYELRTYFKDKIDNEMATKFGNRFIEHRIIPSEQNTSPKADIYIPLMNGVVLAVEIEDKQCHPDTNYIKYYRLWRMQDERPKQLILVQMFGPFFNKHNYESHIKIIELLDKDLRNSTTEFNKWLLYIPVKCEFEDQFRGFEGATKEKVLNEITKALRESQYAISV